MSLTHAATHALREHQLLRLQPRGPVQLCVRSGGLWVTIDGEPVDIELDAGTCRTFDVTAPLLASALGGDAVVTVTPLGAPLWWQRLADRFARPRGARVMRAA